MSPKSYDPRPLFYHLSWRERISVWILVVIILFFFVLYSFEFPRFGNIFQVKSLLIRSLIFFGIIGGIVGFFVSRPEKDLTERLKVFLFIFLSSLFFAPLFGSLANRLFAGESEKKTYEIFDVKPIGTPEKESVKHWSTRDYYIFIFEDDRLEQIRLKDLAEEPLKGTEIELEIREGLFGWKFLN